MGLGFAQMVDPQNGLQVPVLSQFYLMMATLVFLALNGHLILVDVLVGSFQTMPISANGLLPEDFWQLARWGSYVFGGAVSMAIPTIAALLIVNISFGVMNRSAPQLNIFGIGFPVMMLFGFAIIFVTLPSVVPQFSDLVVNNVSMLRDLVTLR
jgi:flagellar biosynthetic protein FliR